MAKSKASSPELKDNMANLKLDEVAEKAIVSKYIGPNYTNRLYVPQLRSMIDPRKMTATQIEQLIKEYQPAAGWFK